MTAQDLLLSWYLYVGAIGLLTMFLDIFLAYHCRSLFETVLSLQPQVSAAGEGDTPEDKVLELAADVLKKIPDLIDYELTAKIMADDPSPLNVVLLQEVSAQSVITSNQIINL